MRKHTQCAVLTWTLLTAVYALAADIEILLLTPKTAVYGGENTVIDLCLLNNTDSTISRAIPVVLPCRISYGRKSVIVNAKRVEMVTMVNIPSKQFVKLQYYLVFPVYTIGSVQIEPATLNCAPLTIEVQKARAEKWVDQQLPIDQGQILAQSFLNDISVHEPMYFLFGVEPGLEQSKFQLSFKYRFFSPEGYIADKAPFVSNFYVGYTQRSIWDLENDSKPFDDTSYMPELFYLKPKIDLNINRVTAFGVQCGFLHESNGQGGDDSRSTNILYIEPILGVQLMRSWFLKIAPNIHTYVNNSESSNDDLMDYRGYVDIGIGIVDPEGLALNSHWWFARKGVTVQLDLTYPMTSVLSKDLNFYLLAQYFSGYAETLLHYKERHDAFRIGFSIVR
ncbi:phospholipase [Desulfosarcina ovata subsp. sediminis]|uniref:Phosphatidylcholine 1-acylhydrolase n=1 Tax=Desulfosarcina ovata subsp. sediminis TaxID=885957 RepID=A0A5K7ZR35_9BACT|nr:phospholipase A [Desulfosarcina ovata]BBO82690.1 phospholipase [Desulfosarcina ovata subsp. sediminis]